MSYPTARDVVTYLNESLAAHGLPYRIEHVAVLPYMNPMWMANWEVPQLAEAPEAGLIEELIREARWQYPQVLEEF